MDFFADEVLTVASGHVVTLTESVYDQPGSNRATRAVIYSHDVSGDSTVGLRYVQDPDTGALKFFPLPKASSITIDGFDNIDALKFILTGAVSAKLFVQYFS